MRGRGRPLKVNGRGPGACALGAAEELGGRGSEREGRGLGRRRGRGVGRAARDARGFWRRLGPTAYYWRPRPRALARATRSLPLLPHSSRLPPAAEVTAWRARPPPAPPRPRAPLPWCPLPPPPPVGARSAGLAPAPRPVPAGCPWPPTLASPARGTRERSRRLPARSRPRLLSRVPFEVAPTPELRARGSTPCIAGHPSFKLLFGRPQKSVRTETKIRLTEA